jgi:hypothetical protein
MNNKNILIGVGIIALAVYLFKKDSSGRSMYGKIFPKEKKCLKWTQPQCITAPCNRECSEYEK